MWHMIESYGVCHSSVVAKHFFSRMDHPMAKICGASLWQLIRMYRIFIYRIIIFFIYFSSLRSMFVFACYSRFQYFFLIRLFWFCMREPLWTDTISNFIFLSSFLFWFYFLLLIGPSVICCLLLCLLLVCWLPDFLSGITVDTVRGWFSTRLR